MATGFAASGLNVSSSTTGPAGFGSSLVEPAVAESLCTGSCLSAVATIAVGARAT